MRCGCGCCCCLVCARKNAQQLTDGRRRKGRGGRRKGGRAGGGGSLLQRGCECLSMTFEGKGEGMGSRPQCCTGSVRTAHTQCKASSATPHAQRATSTPPPSLCASVALTPTSTEPSRPSQATPCRPRSCAVVGGGFALTPTVCTHTRHTHARHTHKHKQSTGRARDKRDGRQTKATLQLKLLALLLCGRLSLDDGV